MSSAEAFIPIFNNDPAQHNYQLTQILGSGGFSEVYSGKDIVRDQDVAIKFFTLPDDAEAAASQLKAFQNEAERARSLHHKNIVEVRWHGMQEHEGVKRPYLVMERIGGGTLRDRREMRGGRLPAEEAVSLIGQTMLGMIHVHTKFTHRDLKPDNILIATDQEVSQITGFPDMRPYGVAKVTDFGAATIVHTNEHTVTENQAVIGTYDYMAPEQFEGRAVASSDVYSLAVLLYREFTGQRPIGNSRLNPGQWYAAHKTQPVASLETAMRGQGQMHKLAAALEGVIMQGLEKETKNRYSTMGDFYEDFAKQVRDTVTRMQRDSQTIDMAAQSGAAIKPASAEIDTEAAPRPEAVSVFDAAILSTHVHTKPGDTPNLTQVLPRKVSRRALLTAGGVGGLAVIGGAGWFLNTHFPSSAEKRAEEERLATVDIAKQVATRLMEKAFTSSAASIMRHIIPHDPAWVAEKALALQSASSQEARALAAKLSFYLPDAALQMMNTYGTERLTADMGTIAVSFAAIADIPDHPHAAIAQKAVETFLERNSGTYDWDYRKIISAVNEGKSDTNPRTGKVTTTREIWSELAEKDRVYWALNAISNAATARNSALLTSYAETYDSWFHKDDPYGGGDDPYNERFGLLQNAYSALAPHNPRAVQDQIKRLANGNRPVTAYRLASILAIELAPYYPDATVEYFHSLGDDPQLAGGTAAMSLAPSHPDLVQKVLDVPSTAGALNTWLELSLNPLDNAKAAEAIKDLTANDVRFDEDAPRYVAGLLLGRNKGK